MKIIRHGTTKRWSDATVFNNVVYMVEVPVNTSGNISQQSLELLKLIEDGLIKFGTSKDNILSATIFLKDIRQIQQFNEIWDNWLTNGSAPSRACVEANMADSEYLVEIQLTAAIVD